MREKSSRILLTFFILAVVCSEYHSLIFTPMQSRSKENQDVKNSESGSCLAPAVENGHVIILGYSLRNYKLNPGQSVPNYMSIKFTCNQNYALFPNKKVMTCYDGDWTSSIPTCKLTCSPLTSTTLDIECTLNNKTADCTQPLLEGTVAKTKCKDFYVSVHTNAVPILRCKGGYWDNSLIECVPDCGEGIAKGLTNIVHGTRAKLGEFPWHVAVYHHKSGEYEYKCGGSIIHPLLVLSAAHCFQDESGVNIPADEYYIAAGKYHSAYNSQEDKLAQIHQVKEYHIPPYYSGIVSNYQADLVVIVLKTKFRLSNLVRPVCIDWNREFEREQLLAGSYGSVVGWGYEVPDKLVVSKTLKKLTAPFIEISKCLTVVPEDFKRWVTPDKFCAGFTTGFSICQGDSGGGMVFPWYVNNKLKYYLRGIVSVGPSDDNGLCDSHQYGVYTQISHYSDFIQEVVANNTEVAATKTCFSSTFGSCQIPKIENGKSIYLDKSFLAGYSVSSYSYIKILCNKGYALYPKKRYIHCVNSTWHIPVPQCKQTCPPLISSLARNVTCTVDDKTVKCSRPVIDGAIAQIICNNGSESFTKCTRGSWGKRDPFSKCKSDGLVVGWGIEVPENSVVCKGDSGSGLVFPWNVNNKLKYYLQGIFGWGSLDNNGLCHPNEVYTQAAHCIDVIQQVEANNTVTATETCFSSSIGSCQIPKIENGKSIYLDKNFLAGYSVPSYSYIQIYCNKGYALYPKKRYVHCVNSTWHIPIPECKQTCPRLTSSLARNITCAVDDKTVQCSQPVIDGAIAQITCKDGSELFTKCTKGSWDKRDPFGRCESDLSVCNNENPIFYPTTTLRPSAPETLNCGCPVPRIENGKFIVLHQYTQGVYVPNHATVNISCNHDYALFPEPYKLIICANGAWSAKIPECKRTCSPIISTSVDVECSVDNVVINCNKPLIEGTTARSKCKHHYTIADPREFSTVRCFDGLWSDPLIRCVPECGNSISNDQDPIRFPWHVGIYHFQKDRHEYVCGGSIITPSVVLSAAHCITSLHLGPPLLMSGLYIAAGKYYSEFNASEDSLAQIRKIQKIAIPPLYRGSEGNYVADISVLIVDKPFELTNVVLPVCVDWSTQFERQLRPNSIGTIIGWRYETNDMRISKILKKSNVPVVTLDTCFRSFPAKPQKYITPDKFCAGYTIETGVCCDSGNGLVFPWTVNNRVKYYLRGIASASLSRECDQNSYGIFTQVTYYRDFIQDIIDTRR